MAKRTGNGILRQAREAKGMSQAEVGIKLGITSAAVGHYEKGIAKPPFERAKKLARMLGIDVAAIQVSSRAQRRSRAEGGGGSMREAPGGKRLGSKELAVVEALRAMPLAKRRPAIEMLLAYAARSTGD